jgi:hypothetical protein
MSSNRRPLEEEEEEEEEEKEKEGEEYCYKVYFPFMDRGVI